MQQPAMALPDNTVILQIPFRLPDCYANLTKLQSIFYRRI